MKVGVLTFHRCINYGSYWQARCMVEGLRELGHDAVLLDHDDVHVRRAEWRNAFQPQLPTRTPRDDIARHAAKARLFLEAFDALPQSPRFPLSQPELGGRYDAVLVGSDEVWNFRHPWYAARPIFFGAGLNTDTLASYAASFGNHDAHDGISAEWAALLERFDYLSVRDENSRHLTHVATGRDPTLVLDPCLQFPPPTPTEPKPDTPYLALYGHGFPEWFSDALRRWAEARDLRIVSIGYRNAIADEQRIEAGPAEFNTLIAQADAVATNFFHGCVFALHHGRPFVSAPSAYRFNKIRDLTHLLAAEHHVVTPETSTDSYDALMTEPLAAQIGERITAMRAQSSAYLADVLG